MKRRRKIDERPGSSLHANLESLFPNAPQVTVDMS